MFGDSGSSCPIRNTMEDMFDIETTNEQIGGVGNNIRATGKGKLKAEGVQAERPKTTTILSPVKYFKDAKQSLLSLTAEMTARRQIFTRWRYCAFVLNLIFEFQTFLPLKIALKANVWARHHMQDCLFYMITWSFLP